MIREVLQRKYGSFVTNHLMSEEHEVLVENYNRDDQQHQLEIIQHLRNLKDIEGNPLVPENFFPENLEWGLDFSGWIGKFGQGREYLLIGAEPHIWKNYQVVYNFGIKSKESIDHTALSYVNNTKDIWFYIIQNFSNAQSDQGKIDFLKKCYITDLCHIVPKNCGQVDAICKTLKIKKREWYSFRTRVAKTFLIDEIEAVNPKYIILHGSASKDFFKNELGAQFIEKYQIANWNRHILFGKFGQYKIIAIPHLKGQMLNELWRSKKFPERPIAAKEIIKSLTTS
jgi:hypothetical protein